MLKLVASSSSQFRNGGKAFSSSLNSLSITILHHQCKINTTASLLMNSRVIDVNTKRGSAKRSVGIVGMPNVGKSTLFNGRFDSEYLNVLYRKDEMIFNSTDRVPKS